MLSPLTASVALGTFTSTPSVSLTGDARVGGTLTAEATDSAPASVEREWAWFTVSESSDSDEDAAREVTPIEGADGPNLALTPALADVTVFARLTVARPGYESASGESSDLTVDRGLLSEPTITVTGTFRVGETLIATSLLVVPTPDRVDWTWYRDTGKFAVERLADGPTLRLTPELLDARVFVTAFASKEGYDLSPAETVPVVVLPGLLATPTVSVSGRARIGQVLTATATTDPTATGTTYQWLRGGAPIAGATARTYRPAAADLGKRLSVRVVSTATGYSAATATSAATSAVTLGAVKLKVTVPGKVTVGKKAAITVRGLGAGERFTVTVAGKRLTGRASAAGVGKVALQVTGKPGKRAVKVVGSVADRAGAATLRVVRRG